MLTPEVLPQCSQGQKTCLVRVMTAQRLNLRLPYEFMSQYSRILSLFAWVPGNSPYRFWGHRLWNIGFPMFMHQREE